MTDPSAALALLDKIQTDLNRLREMLSPAEAFALDPKDPRNKLPDGKLSPSGVEICYQLFEAGKTRYAVAEALGISFAAATHRHEVWTKLGRDRPRLPLD